MGGVAVIYNVVPEIGRNGGREGVAINYKEMAETGKM